MISTSDFSNGLYIYVDGKLYQIIWFQHHKPGKGGAIMRTKLRDVSGGAIIERTFRSGEKFESPEVTRKSATYLYSDPEYHYFLDSQTYEQIQIPKGSIGYGEKFLVENMEVGIVFADGKLIDVEMPATIEVEVEYTEPGVKGDTVTNVLKPAKLKNGLEVKVPLFINTGDRIKIDTRTGKYVERA